MPPWRRRGAGQRAGRRCCRGLGHARCCLCRRQRDQAACCWMRVMRAGVVLHPVGRPSQCWPALSTLGRTTMDVGNALSCAGLPAPSCMPYPRGSPPASRAGAGGHQFPRPSQNAAIASSPLLIVAMETSCRSPCSLATGATCRHHATSARLVQRPPRTLHHSGIDHSARSGRRQASKAAAGAAESSMAPAPPPAAAAAEGQQRQVLQLQAVDITAENFEPFGQARRGLSDPAVAEPRLPAMLRVWHGAHFCPLLHFLTRCPCVCGPMSPAAAAGGCQRRRQRV
jgi:hypothetical protein